MLPLPETDPNRMVPSALGQQSRRVSSIEPGSLPTPRSYRSYTSGTVTSLTTATPTVLTLDVWVQPNETLGLMSVVDLRSSNGPATSAEVYIDGTTSPYGYVRMWRGDILAGGSAFLSAGSTDSPGAFIHAPTPGPIPTNFMWQTPYRANGTWIIQGPSVATQYTLALKVMRAGGTGTITVADPRLWAMVL